MCQKPLNSMAVHVPPKKAKPRQLLPSLRYCYLAIAIIQGHSGWIPTVQTLIAYSIHTPPMSMMRQTFYKLTC